MASPGIFFLSEMIFAPQKRLRFYHWRMDNARLKGLMMDGRRMAKARLGVLFGKRFASAAA